MAKTDWKMDDTVMPDDMNQLGQEINDLNESVEAATNTATANTIIKRDSSGRAKVAAPVEPDDIARKAEVDAAITTAASDATTKANAVQSNLTTHINDNVKHITAAERTAWNGKADKNGTLQTNLNADMHGGWKRYSSLSELGLTNTSTIDDIFNALPINSILEYISPTQSAPLYPFTGSIIRFEKASATRMYGSFTRGVPDQPRFYQSIYASEGTTKWSGWVLISLNDATLQTNLNADMVDGQHGSYYQNASNLNAGTVPAARLPAATTLVQGAMSAADKVKLDGIAARAQVNRAIATQAQAEAGTDNTTDMTPLRVKQAISKNQEEGIWTPTLTVDGASDGITYNIQAGKYFKTGNLVTIFGYIVLSSKGSLSGSVRIEGLPFPVQGLLAIYPSFLISNVSSLELPEGVLYVMGSINLRATVINIVYKSNFSSIYTNLGAIRLTNTTRFGFEFSYFI
ncbi:hypothetical protein J40TS1_40190 [Paenibacillus montaniterrae]|uniref:Tail fiber protein n=1 Tax=Paenibacillus montaniterrae TaxID=429341 RepID=A0A919YPQ2_9BACL|nr:hypothetical protein [Paenibacillus montaniterrae]GIP18377.1 hypothetical protein J40TS1_40190 [Paenibacillus montaniterrae]